MQIIRTIGWILLTALLVAFVSMNWTVVPVNFWPLEKSYLHVNWPVGLIAIFFFLAGLTPMWLLAKAARWRMTRRLAALENTVRAIDPGAPALASAAASHPAENLADSPAKIPEILP